MNYRERNAKQLNSQLPIPGHSRWPLKSLSSHYVGPTSGLILCFLQLRAPQQHALTLLTAQLFPWTKPDDVCAEESGGGLNPQVTAAVLNTSYFPFKPGQQWVLALAWGYFLSAHTNTSAVKQSRRDALWAFWKTGSWGHEKPVFMP